ncbi:MAG: hypothetical protein H6831_02935 [Planctomycetes bacterium]|nr:hypothetical protein [Planctomycetota bacterium]
MPALRTLALLVCTLLAATACLAPDDAPDGTEGQVVRELRASLDRAWRETVAAIHETGVAVPRDQRPEGGTAKIRTDVVRVDLLWLDAERTEAKVIYYDRDALSARVRGEALLQTIEDRLNRYDRD